MSLRKRRKMIDSTTDSTTAPSVSKNHHYEDNADEVLQHLQGLKKALPSLLEREKSHDLREEVLKELQNLTAEIETPWQTLRRTFWYAPWNSITIDIAVKMGLFQHLVSADSPLSATELAKKCNNAEPHFTQRLLRCLNAFGSIQQHKQEAEILYSANKTTKTLTTPLSEAISRFTTGFGCPGWYQLPHTLQTKGYKSLTGSTDTVWSDLYNAPGKTVWEIMADTPYIEDMGTFMAGFNADQQDWTAIYPVNSRLIEGADESADEIFMVDVGGATGSQLVKFKKLFTHARGNFVVTDLEHCLPGKTPAGIEAVPHNFFEPLPPTLHGARVYYLRLITHHWCQEFLIRILANMKEAMKPGYSKLIINDWVVPEEDPHPFKCLQDLCMMQAGGGEERSEARHREAIEEAGLKVEGIWRAGDRISEDVIECVVA